MATSTWLDEKFMERVMRRSENDDSIRVTKLSMGPATNKGDNYTSDMIRVGVDFSRHENGQIITEKRSIIVKVALANDGLHKELIEQAGVFDLEIRMMTTILKEMNLVLKDTKLSGNCLFTQQKDPPLLVIEDLAPLGFRMANRQAGLDLSHSLFALKALAKFHAASVAVCENTPKYKDMCHTGIFSSDSPPGMTKFFSTGMKSLAKAVDSWPGLGESYSGKLRKISDVICGRVADCQKRDDNVFNVINHGDFWVNNMLFKYDNDGKVIDHIFVDFQLCFYGSPAIDLNYFLNTSTAEAVLCNHKDEILAEYLEELTATMRKLGCKTHPPSMAELKEAMQKLELYGLVSACTVLPIVLIDKSQAQDLEELLTQDEATFNSKAYENESYRVAMSRRLPRWNDMGLLDL